MTTPHEDRLSALEAMSPVDLAALLDRVPALASALDGRGPLAHLGDPAGGHTPARRTATRPGGGSASLIRLAVLTGSPRGIELTLASLTLFERQLVVLAAWHGGALTLDQAVADAGPDAVQALEDAARVLSHLLLAHPPDDPAPGRPWLRLRAGVANVVPFPGVGVSRALRHHQTAEVVALLGRLDPDLPTPDDRRDRHPVDRVQALLRDPDVTAPIRASMPEDTARVFDLLTSYGPQRLADLGLPSSARWQLRSSPLGWLLARGLGGLDFAQDLAFVWLDVSYGLAGRLFGDWQPAPPMVAPAPLRADPVAVPPVLARLQGLLDLWRVDPAPALTGGGLGVRPVRAAAKTLDLPAGTVGLLAHVAIRLGILGRTVVGTRGRGRSRSDVYAWAPTPLAADYAALEPAERWAHLVEGWRSDIYLDEAEGLPERSADEVWNADAAAARDALLSLLVTLPDDHGLDHAELSALAAWRTPAYLDPDTCAGIVAALRVLGLAPEDGPVGLTRLARTLLAGGPAGVTATLPDPVRSFTVQADHSVIAPPDLDPELAARLATIADLESAAGARTYRLSERRIGQALLSGEDADDLLAFLGTHSTVPVAQNVAYLLQDCGRRAGQLRAGTVATYLRCDDPALLARAAAVRSAKLRVLAPTVAVTPLTRAKLLAVLRAEGLMPVAEDHDGAVIDVTPPAASPASGDGLPPLPARAEADRLALAEGLLAAARARR